MEFQPWRDYLKLASVIKAMAKAEISDPLPLRDFLLSPAERPENDTVNDENSYMNTNFFIYSPSRSPNAKMNYNPLPTSVNDHANSLLHSDEDQASKTQSTLLPNHRGPNSRQGKASAQCNASPPRGETRQGVMCFFCKHNGESRHIYMGHNLKDEHGKVICPILRRYKCSLCGAIGESSHTKNYCPLNKDKGCLYTKSGRNASGRKVRR